MDRYVSNDLSTGHLNQNKEDSLTFICHLHTQHHNIALLKTPTNTQKRILQNKILFITWEYELEKAECTLNVCTATAAEASANVCERIIRKIKNTSPFYSFFAVLNKNKNKNCRMEMRAGKCGKNYEVCMGVGWMRMYVRKRKQKER